MGTRRTKMEIAWDRVVEAAGSPDVLSGAAQVPADRRDELAVALGSLRIVIRSIPEAEAELQRRVRWYGEHTGPGTQFHSELKSVVAAHMPKKNFRAQELRDISELSSAAASNEERGHTLGHRPESILVGKKTVQRERAIEGKPILSMRRLRDIEAALGRLSHRPKSAELIAAAMTTADQLIKQATTEEVEAAVALVGLDELAAGGRFGAIGDVGIVDSVPLGAVERLVRELMAEISVNSSPDEKLRHPVAGMMDAERKLREDFRVTLLPPSVTVESITYPLKEREALYLETLMESPGDWMTDGEFRKKRPAVGEKARPDQWRKNLPEDVRKWLETHRSKGTRIRRPQ